VKKRKKSRKSFTGLTKERGSKRLTAKKKKRKGGGSKHFLQTKRRVQGKYKMFQGRWGRKVRNTTKKKPGGR